VCSAVQQAPHEVVEAFCYELPEERIAQRPVVPYHEAKLLVLSGSEQAVHARTFIDLPELLRAGDLLIFNNSGVIPARHFGTFSRSGGKVEIVRLRLQAKDTTSETWQCLGRPLKKCKVGTEITFSDDLQATVVERIDTDNILLRFTATQKLRVDEAIAQAGVMPIPPYIRDGRGDAQDIVDYQPMFARTPGSIAAPTASLHFTPELLATLDARGVMREELTLHVGSASFLPLWSENLPFRAPGKENFVADPKLIARIIRTRNEGGRVIAVGTTVVRALESMALLHAEGRLSAPCELDTELFIKPGHRFQALDGLITNFHQPKTTHLLLVEALIGRTRLAEAYHYALEHDFRFLSYGDGMIFLS
jgi:S-adenosylmethionine:tRNA ribosyltransferase-isomerase